MSGPVSVSTHGRTAVATVDHPPVNALSHAVRAGLNAAIERLESDAQLDALVIVCAGKTFFSGADIKEFGKPMLAPLLGDLIDRIEGAAKPVVAAIHGKALGGGLELALGCHYRVAVRTARFGLPEVRLGLIPGAGGTQRLPRLVGLETAIRVVSEGAELDAVAAHAAGLLDELIEGDLTEGALGFTEALVASGRGVRRTADLPPPPEDPARIAEARKNVARRFRGQTAPQTALDALEWLPKLPFREALVREHAVCVELLGGTQSRAMRHVFAAERAIARVPGLGPDVAPRRVERVAVTGLGVMGIGIVQAFANAGLPVVAHARSATSLERALTAIRKAYATQVARGQLAQAEADRRLGAIVPSTADAELAQVDLVCESVAEDLAVKREVFAALGRATRPGTVLATNTSYLDIDTLAVASGRPADVCGLHFFNPATAMRLVEVVRGAESSAETVATAVAVARGIGKLPIVCGVADGFVVNRLLARRSREAAIMLEQGARPEQIDRVLQEFGFPMGPYALADLAGIDVQYAARQARRERLSQRERAANFVEQLHALGRYGQKSGAGWYRYDENRRAAPDPAIAELLAAHASARGITPRDFDDREILERCLYAMVNEGARLIDERIVPRPEEIDVAMVNGVGFPIHAGGPLWWADEVGLERIHAAMSRWSVEDPEGWQPAALLGKLAQTGGRFYAS
jgi:3-hydroxyacyl-CoA dehydrogenase